MHVEIQVALNFVISYLYNKLPRRRVNLFGEELEKALKEKFVGHWYPEKPFKGSAFRCLKTGDPTDAVLDRAARESGVPIADILENLPAELAVWIDPGEVSYRIGEKGLVKILYSETNEHHEDSSNDREVTKTFNPEAQCFQPIEAVSSCMNGLSLSPKGSPPCTVSPISESSPTFAVVNQNLNSQTPITNTGNNITVGGGNSSSTSAGSTGSVSGGNNPTSPAPTATGGAFLQRSQAPLTFTTATFAQTKFGSTKLKTNSKRANRMSPTEFSNYIKQRAMQQQLHHSHGGVHLGPSSPSRSLSPNPLALGLPNDPYFFQNVNMGMYGPPAFNNVSGGQPPRNMFDSPQFHHETNNMCGGGPNKFNGSYLEPHNFYNNVGVQQNINGGGSVPNIGGGIGNGSNVIGINQTASVTPVSSPGSNPDNAKLLDGLNSFYSNPGPYQHLLVAN